MIAIIHNGAPITQGNKISDKPISYSRLQTTNIPSYIQISAVKEMSGKQRYTHTHNDSHL